MFDYRRMFNTKKAYITCFQPTFYAMLSSLKLSFFQMTYSFNEHGFVISAVVKCVV